MRTTRILLLAGLTLFVAGTWAAFRFIAGETSLRWVMFTAIGLSVVLLGLASWRLHRGVDFDRIAAEQRLWESGPLGRLWLRVRRALFWSQ
ncbi:hypothetical protein ACGF5M_05465 [Gemmatimonadota bacterium]